MASEGSLDLHEIQQRVRRTVGRWVNDRYCRRPMIVLSSSKSDLGKAGSVTNPAATVDSAQGWRNVGVAFVSMFVVFGVAYSFGAFFESMSDEFGASSGATSAVFSLTAFCYYSLGFASGRAMDRYGPSPVLVVGAVAMLAGLSLTAAVDWPGT